MPLLTVRVFYVLLLLRMRPFLSSINVFAHLKNINVCERARVYDCLKRQLFGSLQIWTEYTKMAVTIVLAAPVLQDRAHGSDYKRN